MSLVMGVLRFLCVLFLQAGLVVADSQNPRLFWTDKDDGELEVADLDGGNRATLLSGLADPRGIAVDPIQRKIYWASHESNGAIFKADCDGTNIETFLNALSEPADLVLDLVQRKIYWAEEGGNRIRRAKLDGTPVSETVIDGLNRPYYLALDREAGFLYWSDFNSSIIHRATMDGADPINFITGQSRVRDIEIANGMIYWCDRNSSQLRRRDLDGAGGGTVLFSGSGLDRPHGLVLDPEANTMYWTDTRARSVSSGKMDGSGSVTTLASVNLTGAWAITLVRPSVDPYQAWLSEFFTQEEISNPANEMNLWGEDADPDDDGRVNLLEFAQGTNPRSGISPTEVMQALVKDGKFLVVFRIRNDDPSLNYVMEAAESLDAENWRTNFFGDNILRMPDASDTAYEFITVESNTIGVTTPKLFARLRVSR